MILLWGIHSDGPLAAVKALLERRGSPLVFVDQRLAAASDIELSPGACRGSSATLWIEGEGIDLDRVSAAYLRPHDSRRVASIARAGAGSELWRHAAMFDGALWSWAETTPALVVNRRSAMATNGSKPYQS